MMMKQIQMQKMMMQQKILNDAKREKEMQKILDENFNNK